MIYSIVVGRWAAPFSFVWYADVHNSEDHHRITTFNALSKRSARRKAAKFVRRYHRPNKPEFVYTYDATTNHLSQNDS